MKRLLIAFATFLPLLPNGAWAAVDALASTVAPATAYVASDRPGFITLTWRVRSSSGPTVASPAGRFLIPTAAAPIVIGTVPTPLNRALAAGATTLFTESVQVPLAVIREAQRQGASGFNYQRGFADPTDALPVSISARIVVTGAQAAGLGATRQAIAFDDNSPVRVVALRQPLAAWSEVTLSGSGLLEGVWEIAEPPSTSGQAVFRTLQVVRRFAHGGAPLRLDSPALPTTAAGLYLLRLRLTQPLPEFDAPEIRYFVAQSGATPVAHEVKVLTPRPGAPLEDNTRFAWAPLEGVHSWLLLLHARPTGLGGNLPELGPPSLPDAAELAQLATSKPVAGGVVPGGQTATTLSALARTHLQPGHAYLWRVLGLGKDGVVLGESPWREIRVP